jgi:heme-degrading monooxygenase HmoA
MIGRLWKTGLKPGRDKAYEEFARDISLPMFKQQEGFLGCVMSHNQVTGFVLTFWRDKSAVTALEKSLTYQQTVAQILAADLLVETQETSVCEVHIADLEGLISELPVNCNLPATGNIATGQ